MKFCYSWESIESLIVCPLTQDQFVFGDPRQHKPFYLNKLAIPEGKSGVLLTWGIVGVGYC